jgi:sugar O-acyltransferase (sialic acid O-acetyltransferase NeuD family)
LNSIILLGAGGWARELYWFVRDTWPQARIVFVDDVSEVRGVEIAGTVVPVVKDWEFEPGFDRFLVGVAEPALKRPMVVKALAAGLEPAPTLVHTGAIVRPDCTLGRGGAIVAHSQLTTNATIGDYVCVLDSTIGHHNVVGDYTTCFPGCRISGDVVVGEDCLFGAGTIVRNGLRIASGVTTGAGTVLVKDVEEEGVTMVGVPGRRLG